MKFFYTWISVLINEYEPIISSNLLKIGYEVNKASNEKSHNARFLDYRLENPSKSIQEVENDINNIINDNKLIIHGYLVSEYLYNSKIMWRGSNIDNYKIDNTTATTYPSFKEAGAPKIKSVDNEELEDVMATLNRIIDKNSNNFRESRLN